MKKLNKIFVILISLFIFNINVYAIEESSCSNADIVNLGKEAVSVKVSYEEKEEKSKPGKYAPPEGYDGDPDNYVRTSYYFQVNIMNITDNLYVEIANNVEKDSKIINVSDSKNGIYSFDWKKISNSTTFSYSIKASSKTGCYGKELKKGILSLPAYNKYYTYSPCKGHEDYYLCKRFISKPVTYAEYVRNMNKYNEKLNNKSETKTSKEEKNDIVTKIKSFYKDNKKIVYIGGIIVTISLIALIIISIIKYRKRVI